MLNKRKKSWNSCADYVSPRRKQSEDKYQLGRGLLGVIIQQIVTLSKYGHDALDIRHP